MNADPGALISHAAWQPAFVTLVVSFKSIHGNSSWLDVRRVGILQKHIRFGQLLRYTDIK